MGRIYVEGYFYKKWSFFFPSLKAYYGQVFNPIDKTFAFLILSWHGNPKKVRNDTRLLFGGSGAMGGLGWFLK